MAFWSGETLLSRCPSENLISDFDKNQIDCNSYTLRMGEHYFCTGDGSRVWERATKKKLSVGGTFVIPPGQFAFLETKDRIKVPDDAMAFISMKAKIKFQGLINVSGFHVDPGYSGRLIFSVYNGGPSAVHLEEGMDLFLIWFAQLDRKSAFVRKDGSEKTISNDLIKGMSHEMYSLHSIYQDIAALKVSMKVQAYIFGAATTVLVGLLIATANFIFQHGIDKLIDPNGSSTTTTQTTTTGAPASPNTPGNQQMPPATTPQPAQPSH